MDLQTVLTAHLKWLAHKGGKCANLAYANLADADLAYADLAYANLTHANLSYANLAHANLAHANLAHADLAYANLAHADLTNIIPNWQSHNLISTLLARECETVEQWKVAGFIALRTNLCWQYFLSLKDPLTSWALSVLQKYETPDNLIPFKEVPNGDDRG